MWIWLLPFLAAITWSTALDNWPSLSFEAQVAIRTQRDVSYPVPIDQDTNYGVSLSSLVFEKEGYSSDALDDISSLLNVGVRTLVLDLYYNNFTDVWQLCPAPYPLNGTTYDGSTTQTVPWNHKSYRCQPSFTVDSIMRQISTFLSRTDTNMNANYIQLLYRLHQFDYPQVRRNATSNLNSIYYSKSNPYSSYGNASLSDTVSSLGSTLFTPSDLSSFRASRMSDTSGVRTFYNQSSETFPTLNEFIFTMLKRTSVAIIYDDVTSHKGLYSFSSRDEDIVFVDNSTMNLEFYTLDDKSVVNKCLGVYHNTSGELFSSNFSSFALESHFRFISDTGTHKFDESNFKAMVACGLSPILNNTKYTLNETESTSIGDVIDFFLPSSFWSWTRSLLRIDKDNDEFTENDDDEEYAANKNDGRTQKAYKCVLLAEGGWEVGNCYDEHPYICQMENNPFKWVISEERKQYFDAYKKNSCPEGYIFGVPRSSVEMVSVMHKIASSTEKFPVWIDVNDITVTNCFVTGGPYAECPYQKTVSTGALARIIAPSFVIAVVVLLLIFMENVFRVNPIHTNRKRYWKKKINDFNKENDHEGVPS